MRQRERFGRPQERDQMDLFLLHGPVQRRMVLRVPGLACATCKEFFNDLCVAGLDSPMKGGLLVMVAGVDVQALLQQEADEADVFS